MYPGDSDFKSDDFYIKKIEKLRRERNAVILAHNYQRAEIQDIADFVGDSLGLSQKAASTNADVIVFCGVSFMAETAATLAPEKKVLLPDMGAGCPMADMITAESLRAKKKEHSNAVVVCYVNSSAEVKAESDICCTSSNAVKIAESLDEREILFVPDEHLGRFVASKTGKNIIYWEGYCPTHLRVTVDDILEVRTKYPNATILVHPECSLDIIALADEALSTGGIINYVNASKDSEFIIGTEYGLIHQLEKQNKNKKFHLASKQLICPNMKLTTLDKVADVLENLSNRIVVEEEIRKKAVKSLDRMLSLSGSLVKC